MGLAIVLVLATSPGCRCSQRDTRTDEQKASPAPPCGTTAIVRARVAGRFVGEPAEGTLPALIIAVESTHPEAMIARVALASPEFAAEYSLEDLCTDEGSTADRLALRCLSQDQAKVKRLIITRDGGGLAVTEDSKQILWEPTFFANQCFELHGLDHRSDLDTLRSTYRLDAPKCPRDPSAPPVKVRLRIDASKTTTRCSPDHMPVEARVSLLGAGAPKDLGILNNLCGATGAHRWPNLSGLQINASDMGISQRFVYQLGDRVYYSVEDGHVRAAELPCGARAVFDHETIGLPRLRESEPP